jgi:hypothetical protein
LKVQLPSFLKEFKATYSKSINKTPFGIADYLQKNEKHIDFKEAYKGLQISYETLAPDPFILDYTKEYVEATKLKLIVDSILSQKKPDIEQYLAKTRELIQSRIELDDIKENAPVFVVDNNYLKNLDGTKLTEHDKELTLENRLRTVLRIKAEDLPIYKTLQERLETIIKQRGEEVDNTYSLLSSLMGEVNEVQSLEDDNELSMGERAIHQMLSVKLDNEELVQVILSELNEEVLKHTTDFKNWQEKDTVVATIKRDIIIKLAMLSKVHSAIQKEKIDYSLFAEELMKYIIRYY